MIEFRTLGGLELRGADGRDVTGLLAQPKRLAFLAYLALASPHGYHRRDSLLAIFWPESDAEHARASLRKTLHVLRRSAVAGAITARGDEDVGLDAASFWCDASAFEAALNERRPEEALELYRGELLPGFFIPDAPAFEAWLETERARLARCALDAGRALVGRAEAEGNLPLAAQWAHRVVGWAPDDELAVSRLIALLDRLGDRAGAIRGYEQFARRLSTEYGVMPSAETLALISAVRSRTEMPLDASAAGTSRPRSGAAGGGPPSVVAGRYAIQHQLGRAGSAMAAVARDLEENELVTLKILRPELAAGIDVPCFVRELEPARSLQHPGVATIRDAGWADGLVYYVTAAIDGESLRAKTVREGELPVAEALSILRGLAEALAYSHGRGVVHHDIKPSRVMMHGRQAVLTDLGVAAAIRAATDRVEQSSTGIAIGTPAYMAPEQVLAEPVLDHRVDIYAMGALAYALLTGQPPFGGRSPQAVFAAQVMARPEALGAERPAVPPGLAALVMQCLEKRPADRPQSAAELLRELEAVGA